MRAGEDLALTGGAEAHVFLAPAFHRLLMLAEHAFSAAWGIDQHAVEAAGHLAAHLRRRGAAYGIF